MGRPLLPRPAMPIKVKCSECGRAYNLGDDRAGQALECKGCGATFDVPDAAADRRGGGDRERPGPREEDDRRASRKPAEKKSMLPLLLVGGGAALLLLLLC